jgi:ArsR family transcriptional regulator
MEDGTKQLIAQLKALADPVRLRTVALCAQGECSVSELTKVLGYSQPRVSQHLKQLCAANILERFRDGHFVYYRVATRGDDAALRRRLLSLIPADDAAFGHDTDKLRALRGVRTETAADDPSHDRPLHRALVALTVATPLGDLVDIGCGQGRILKLLASRARRAVGVDIDSDARRFARAELLLAGLPNCSLRQGDMYALPLADSDFDTAILDDVLSDAARPTEAIAEAVRILRPGGRLLMLSSAAAQEVPELRARLAGWCAATELRLAPARAIPAKDPEWLLAVATKHDTATAAA